MFSSKTGSFCHIWKHERLASTDLEQLTVGGHALLELTHVHALVFAICSMVSAAVICRLMRNEMDSAAWQTASLGVWHVFCSPHWPYPLSHCTYEKVLGSEALAAGCMVAVMWSQMCLSIEAFSPPGMQISLQLHSKCEGFKPEINQPCAKKMCESHGKGLMFHTFIAWNWATRAEVTACTYASLVQKHHRYFCWAFKAFWMHFVHQD